MQFLNKIISWLNRNYPNQMERLGYKILPLDMVNINLDLTNKNQKRVLICYLYLMGINLKEANHAAFMHYNQIISYFIKKNYCVDTCFCLDESAFERLKNNKYDVIFGFGKPFKAFCKNGNINQRILFITENNPEVVKQKYSERLYDFKIRHPKVSTQKDHIRNEYFDREQFELCSKILQMSSVHNATTLRHYEKPIRTINANAIFNDTYVFNNAKVMNWIQNTKKQFLWFGSNGFIHKGCDLILDVFRELPDYHIDFYGLSKSEMYLFKQLAPSNARNCGRVNVQSEEFVENVVSKYSFLVFPSCSEGMSTAICTCMAHGIIPIVTKESGLDPHPAIIELKDWNLGEIKTAIIKASSMTDNEILYMRKLAYEYAREAFALEHFDRMFTEIMDDMLKE